MNYRLTDESVKILLLGFVPLLNIKYGDIAAVELLSFSDSLRPSYARRFGNRLFAKEAVVIRKKKIGIFYGTIVTPGDPRQFIADVNKGRIMRV